MTKKEATAIGVLYLSRFSEADKCLNCFLSKVDDLGNLVCLSTAPSYYCCSEKIGYYIRQKLDEGKTVYLS